MVLKSIDRVVLLFARPIPVLVAVTAIVHVVNPLPVFMTEGGFQDLLNTGVIHGGKH